jgi:tRNA pseudouridine55 synthase
MNGVLVVDKPTGITSHDVVARVRRICQEKSVGHLGTLDPMATGVLPLLLGKYTRLAQFFGHAAKEYEGTIQFGWTTNTYDADGEPASDRTTVAFSPETLKAAVEEMSGPQQQIPPAFSAKKVKGVPAYKLARKQLEVALEPKPVEVIDFEVEMPDAHGKAAFKANVSAGTYVRSLAHDLGQKLGCGAHLAELRRTRSGEFGIEQAVTLEQLEQNPAERLISVRTVLRQMPNVIAAEDQLAKIRNGNAANLPEFSGASMVKVFEASGELICVASRIAGTLFQPRVVFC